MSGRDDQAECTGRWHGAVLGLGAGAMRCVAVLVLIAMALGDRPADAAQPGFRPASQPGCFEFDTGVLRGRIRADGRNQGMDELIHLPSGQAVARGGELPGLLSLYRVFSAGTRYGDAARDWPTENRVSADGTLVLRWPPAKAHPLEMIGRFHWTAADTLDLDLQVRPEQPMPGFELFLSNYLQPAFQGRVFTRPNLFSDGPAAWVAADVNPLVEGSYLMFPRDREAVRRIFDGRWEAPPHPVQWSVTRWLAAPLLARRDPATGMAALLMARPEHCFAMALPYNQSPPDGVAGHYSAYLSLFGSDLEAGKAAAVRVRLVVGPMATDAAAHERYREFLQVSRSATAFSDR